MAIEKDGYKMSPRVFSLYRRYLAQDVRSLVLLAQDGGSPSIATLKRWSVRYDWIKLAAAHDELLAKRMSEQFNGLLLVAKHPDLGVLPIAKRTFYNRIDRDIANALARGKGPAPSRQISVRDFIRLIRLERDLLSCRAES